MKKQEIKTGYYFLLTNNDEMIKFHSKSFSNLKLLKEFLLENKNFKLKELDLQLIIIKTNFSENGSFDIKKIYYQYSYQSLYFQKILEGIK